MKTKFRLWDKDAKKFFEPAMQLNSMDIYMTRNGDLVGTNGAGEMTSLFEVVEFTHILDKNERDIYEGDIVKFHYFYGALGEGMGFVEAEHSLIGVVRRGAFGWGVEAISGEHWEGYTGYNAGEGEATFMELLSMNESGIHEESFEVIGNEFENPELLK